MFTQAYSFTANSSIIIMTEAQLAGLIAERRARGMSEENLVLLEVWHRAHLQSGANT